MNFSPRSTRRSDSLYLLSFFLLEWTFLQSFGKSDVTPVFTLPILACWDFHPLLFSFTSCISTPWHFVKTFRILLRYWGLYFRFLMSFIFQRRFQIFHRVYFVLLTFSEGGLMLVFSVFSAISDRDIYLSTCSWGYCLGWLSIIRSAKVVGKISSRSRASWLVWSTNYVEYLRYFNPLLFWWSIVQGGLQHFWKVSFVLLTSIPGSIFSDFCYPLPFTKKVLTGRFPSLWRSFVCSHLLLFIWVGEDKNRGNNIIG